MYHPETLRKMAAQKQQQIHKAQSVFSLARPISHEREQDRAQKILLERQGTMWEGSGKKELPVWMSRPEAAADKQISVRKNPLVRLGRLLGVVLEFGVKS